MFATFTVKGGNQIIVQKEAIMFAHENGKYTRLELDDGTPIDVLETLQQVKDICQGKYE